MKINKFITSLIVSLLGFVFAPLVQASVISIQQLPSYISTNNFKLSCTSDGNEAQFYVSKNSGSYTAFGPVIDLSVSQCQVQVTSAEVNDQTNYTFKVLVDGVLEATTTTFYDTSGPSPVSGYYKEKVGDGAYKLHWKNPGDGDFSKVVIYRGETADFSADGSHEIARVSGGANSEMTYDENQPDPNKTYYYLIRALDKANNSSSLVGDTSSTTTTTTSQATSGSVLGSSTGKSGAVTSLPKEGSILGEETTSPTSTPEETTGPVEESSLETFMSNGGLLNWVRENKVASIVIAFALGFLAYTFYRLQKKK